MISDILIILLVISVAAVLGFHLKELLPLKARLEETLKQFSEERAKAQQTAEVIYDREINIPFIHFVDILKPYKHVRSYVQGEAEIQQYHCASTDATITLHLSLNGDKMIKRVIVTQPNCDVQCSTEHIQRISSLISQYERVVLNKGIDFRLSPNNRPLKINPNHFYPYDQFIRTVFPFFTHEVREGAIYTLNGDSAARPDLLAIAIALKLGDNVKKSIRVAIGTGDVLQDDADIIIVVDPHPQALHAAAFSQLSFTGSFRTTYIFINAPELPGALTTALRRLTPNEVLEITRSPFNSLFNIKSIPTNELFLQQVLEEKPTTAVVPATQGDEKAATPREGYPESKTKQV